MMAWLLPVLLGASGHASPGTPEARWNTDTTVSASASGQLHLENFSGDVHVRSWERAALRVRATHSARVQVHLAHEGGEWYVKSSTSSGIPRSVDYEISLPRGMGIQLQGVNCEADLHAVIGPIQAETVNGSVSVTGAQGVLKASSVQGSVTVTDSRGRMQISAVNDGVTMKNCGGSLVVESVNGEVRMEGMTCDSVRASSVNGCLVFSGELRPGGHYQLSSHNGDVDVAVPGNAGAQVNIRTYSGAFESTFPVTIRRTGKDRQLSFVLGSGAAHVNLDSFQGTVRLRRPGDDAPACGEDGGGSKDEENADEESDP